MASTIDASITLPHSQRAPSQARRWLADLMVKCNRSEDIDTALLIVGELVTNAIRYARGQPVLTVDEVDGALRCAVHDDNPAHPVLCPPYAGAEGGRGMWLVAGLSAAWGVEGDGVYPHGKVVWCRLPCGRHAPVG